MRIQHNITAMTAYRNYTINNSALSKNLEKLSSGFKINRAGDDAAGLAISEKMRAQITGLDVAQKNAKDGISLVQTAEGALTEVHDMLNRMVELATQSANGTYADDLDREQLQKEVNDLRSEINRIAESANFNGINLLDGSLGMNGDAFTIGSMEAVSGNKEIASIATILATAATNSKGVSGTNTILKEAAKSAQIGSFTIDLQDIMMNATAADSIKLTINGKDVTIANQAKAKLAANTTYTASGIAAMLAEGSDGNNTNVLCVNANGTTVTITDSESIIVSGNAPKMNVAGGAVYSISASGTKLKFTLDQIQTGSTANDLQDATVSGAGANLTAGAISSAALAVVNLGSNSTITIGAAANTTTVTGHYNVGLINVKDTVLGGGGELADTVAALDMSKITDGTRLTIGVNEYLFAVGSQSAYATKATADGAKVINLSAYTTLDASASDGPSAAQQIDIMQTIDNALADNHLFNLGVTGSYGKISLTEKTDANYDATTADPAKGLLAKTADEMTAISKALETKDGIASMFSAVDSSESINAGTTITFANGSAINDTDVLTLSMGSSTVKVHFLKDTGNNTDTETDKYVSFTGTETAASIAAKVAKAVGNGAKVVASGIEMTTANGNPVKTGNATVNFGSNVNSVLGKGLTLQIGDTSDDFNKLYVLVNKMDTHSMGIGDIDISTQEGAAAAVDKIKNAINYVSDVRGTLGATQNRLDHTINNLSVMAENITDAESTIRDTDMAAEMMAYTKNNILVQAAQAMLAQANQLPQGVLQLLQ